MSGAEIVAIISVVGTAAVALATPWMTHRFGLLRFMLETGKAREDELREHLDQAAIRLTEARTAVVSAMQSVRRADAQHAQAIAIQAYDTLNAQLEQLRKNVDRLGVRLGSSSPITISYSDAAVCIQRATELFAQLTDGTSPGPEISGEVQRFLDDAIRAQDRFHDAASAVIGLESYAHARDRVRELRRVR